MIPGGTQRWISGPQISGTSVTADDTLTFRENDVPESGKKVRELLFDLAGGDASDVLTNVTRLTFKGGGVPFIDTLPTYIRAYLGFMGKKAEWSTARADFMFPLHGFRGWSAPPGQNLRLTVSKNVTMKTPTITLHEGLNDSEESAGFMYMLSSLRNVPVSATRYPVSIDTPGILVGMFIPTPQNITLFRYYDAAGLAAEFTDVNALLGSEYIYQGTTVTDPIYWKVPVERLVTAGVTRLELGTNSSWTDAELGFHTYIPAPPSGK